jgi:hypothetical protein
VRTTFALVLLTLVTTSAGAETRVLHVANFGIDSTECGRPDTPCRSISQAIRNASDGDTVFVAPGLYGDLNRNGVVGETGEEGSDAPSASCLVCVSKRLTLLSQRGAAHTTIDARNLPLTAVTLSRIFPEPESVSVFGYVEQGFTVLAGEREGISMAGGGIVWGNRIIGGTIGVQGSFPTRTTEIYENEITEAAERGIAIYAGRVWGNVVARNGAGISAFRDMEIENNTIADNRGHGVYIGDPWWPNVRISRNVLVRNAGAGVVLSGDEYPDHCAPLTGECYSDVGIFSNDFIGNDPQGSCGIDNRMGARTTVWAGNNFWAGAPDFGVAQQIVCGASSRTEVNPPKARPH